MSSILDWPKGRRYLRFNYPDEYSILRKNFYLKDVAEVVLCYLPDYEAQKKFRKLNKQLKSTKHAIVYWYQDLPTIPIHLSPLVIKRQYKSFVRLWFSMLLNIEGNSKTRNIYTYILFALERFKHIGLIVINNDYIILDDDKFVLGENYVNVQL